MLQSVLVAATMAIVWAVWTARKRFRPKARAMKQYARSLIADPDVHRELDEEFERRYALRVAAQRAAEGAPLLTPAELPAAIAELLDTDPLRHDAAEIRIKKVLAAAEPHLLAAIDDPRATWDQDESQGVPTAPAQRVVGLLAKLPSRALGDRIGHLVGRPEWSVSDPAIKARTALGRTDQLPFVLEQLAKQSQPAQEGVELAIEQGWAEPEFLDGIRVWAERTALDPALPFSYWAVGFYARHGGAAALEALSSPQVLSVANNRTVHAALKQLNEHGVRLDAKVVRPLLDAALTHTGIWPWNCTFGPALRALAATEPEAALRMAEEYLNRPDDPHHSDAARFIQETAGLPEPYDIKPPAGMELTEDERTVLGHLTDCINLYGEICNGGLSQYFFNFAGGDWRRHVAALRAIGFETGAAALEEAARVVHPDGASTDRGTRIAQYAALSERQEKRLDELSPLFWSDVPRLRFMLRHRELFARLRAARER
ncbi:DMP19 family protein [Gemmata sp. JC717]|uniref:DMP19 family protein n=1 Tax=Gemmata algarum TaxID=2975278 RepID=UPI0021BB78EB|nr:DMP19 family protein [Gemmata algarum]MDY3556251.1 DMP19 family protein [Gemmata algarum]